MKVNIITKNPSKILAAENLFSRYNIETVFIKKDYPEIQTDTSIEIAKFTALQAAKEFDIPIIREDHSFFLNAWGIPGPYMNYFERKLPVKKLLEIMSNESDRTGYFEVATAHAYPNDSVKEYVFQVPIKIALEEKGKLQSGWNRVIQFKNETRTFAEYPERERLGVWEKNYQAIAEELVNK